MSHFATLVFCQEQQTPFSLGIGATMDIISNKDLAASPLSYNGFGLPIGINGFKRSVKWIHSFNLQFTLPVLTNNYPLKSKANTVLKTWSKVKMNYSVLRNLKANQKDYLGGGFKSEFFWREYHFLDGLSWDFQTSLDISYARRIKLSDRSFVLPQISMPLLGFTHRRPSLTFDEIFLDDFYKEGLGQLVKYGKWRLHFDAWWAIDFQILYQLKLSEKLSFQSTIGLHYYTLKFPRRVSNLNIPVQCALNFHF